jgi:hypothetical protein
MLQHDTSNWNLNNGKHLEEQDIACQLAKEIVIQMKEEIYLAERYDYFSI